MKTQIALEDSFHSLAKNTSSPAVIICDRGLMDTLGYVGPKVFSRILNRMNYTAEDLRDNRYDAVVHLVSAADGAEEFYNQENEARFETVEQAAFRCRELRKAYIGHNKLYVINNRDTFRQKMNYTISTVLSVLGLPTSNYRYKKFLVDTRGLAGTCQEIH